MKFRGNLKEKGDMLRGGEVAMRDDNFRAPQLEKKAAKKGKRKGGKGRFSARDAAQALGKRC